MKNKTQIVGHLACFAAYTILGFNIIVCKDLANSHFISPLGLFSIRAIGATLLFWLISLFMPKEKVEKKDFPRIFFASLLGLFIPQTTFLLGITMVTSLDTSIISPLSPIFTMIIAAIVLKEPITLRKSGGVLLSFAGILLLIFNSIHISRGVAQTKPLGIVILVLNSISFAMYLGIFRPLIAKYSVITFMKWMFLFSLILSLPFTAKELISLDLAVIPANYFRELSFLVLFSTFITYFLIPVGQKALRPTVVSLYTYMKPLIASIMSILLGMDVLNWQKGVAAVAILSGVTLVNCSRAAYANKS